MPGLLTNYLSAQKKAQQSKDLETIKMIVDNAMVGYIGVLADIAFQLQDELFEQYIDSPTYNRNAKFRMIINQYKVVSEEHYDWYNNLVKDADFYNDLRDEAMDYITPFANDLYNAFCEAYRKGHNRYSKMLSMCALILCVIDTIDTREREVRTFIKKTYKASISGTDKYRLSNEKNYVTWILDNLGKKIDDTTPSLKQSLQAFSIALSPSEILRASVVNTFESHPERTQGFKKIMGGLYKIKWT